MADLAGQLDRYCHQIEGDLWTGGTDLRDLFRPGGGASRLTWRRLNVLLDALPGDGLYKTAVRDSFDDEELVEMSRQARQGHGRWTHTDLLLADIIDRLGHLGYALRVYEKPPPPYSRPGVVGRRKLSTAGRAYLQALIDNNGATPRPMSAGRPGEPEAEPIAG